MDQGLKVVFTILLVTASAAPALAVNWEGHENFFMEAMPVPEFTEGIAPPLSSPLLSCAERRKRRETNAYEQEAIAGVNCKESINE